MDRYSKSLKYLYGLQSRGMKFGLRNVKALLKSVGNPHKHFRSIHVAGTNGKGSTASFLASIFMEAGYTTALYTSPHLILFTERIRINGKEISEDRLVSYTEKIREAVETVNATFFEATTCIAFRYFADEGVDIAIIEAGLGGRLDSTNVLEPLASVITNVSYDHMEQLGNTLEKISREKAGIIKTGVPCITSSTNPIVLKELWRTTTRKQTRLVQSERFVSVRQSGRTVQRARVSFGSSLMKVPRVTLGLVGDHQIQNARTAVACVNAVLQKRQNRELFRNVTPKAVKRGLERVVDNSGIQGRLQQSRVDRRFVFDVAHNPDGLETLLKSQSLKNFAIVFGVMSDKDHETMIRRLAETKCTIIAVEAKTSRALKSVKLVEEFERFGKKAIVGRGVAEGIRLAKKYSKDNRILVTGSHYVVGEALIALGETV